MDPRPEARVAEPLFTAASRTVLAYLHGHVPMAFWAVTRVENGRQTYLTVQDDAYDLEPGGSHDWEASFCVHMVSRTAPAVAPDAQQVPRYADAGVNEVIDIGAYAGSAILDVDGSLFGALCGLDPDVQPPELAEVEPLLVLLSELLTTALVADRRMQSLERVALQARLSADVDQLSGVYSRGAWSRLLEEEASFFTQLADPTCVVMVDLDGLKATNDAFGHAAGDDLIRRAAEAISGAVRTHDPVARLGGDEFGVLLRDCTAEAATERAQAIRLALASAGVSASLGVASASPSTGLLAAQSAADRAMYDEKREHRSREHARGPVPDRAPDQGALPGM